ncbi:hypothetical protein [Thiocapsa marina]|uniref:Uncharacterized protein n=1 Tax=Thiocapsa marina 5811 TaxID=768671 RepID=F9UIS0_9GAMM|nr:hypothetical protein [Thiocapsa marina]EGV15901.1 hypothetical protein ThimaDRAFT_4823 [Thiocapsa marina 5811]
MHREHSDIGPLLDSGTLTELRPLGEGGDQVFRSAPELRHAIEQRLGPDVAAALAIPQSDESGSRFDWYAPNPGTVRRWSSLAEDELATAKARLDEVERRITALADEMSRDDGSSKDVQRKRQSLARLLRQVMTYPDASHLFLVDHRPVIAFWGFSRRAESDPTAPLGDGITIGHPTDAQRMRPPPSLADRVSRLFSARKPRLLTVGAVGALLLLTLGLVLLRDRTENTAPDEPGAAADETPPGSQWPAPGEDEPGEPIVIPIDAIATGSTDFLTGQWRALGDQLTDNASGQPIQLTYRMQAGRGEVLVKEQDGTLCRADVTASFDGRVLVLTPLTDVRCPADSGLPPYYGVTVTCQPTTDQRSSCTGKYPDGEEVRVELLRQPD